MRIKATLLCAALVAAPLQAQATAATVDDARAVIAAVLAHQASIRGPEGGAETCVAEVLAGPPAAPGVDDDGMAPDHSVRIYFQWHVPDAPPPARAAPPPEVAGQRRNRPRAAPPPPPPAPLATAETGRLNALRAEAARAPSSPTLTEIDPAQIPAPLHVPRRGDDDCAMLTLSAPAFAGDAAFVEIAYACGTVCGNGGLYALQRREGRWELVGIADIWIR
jgi:hypothetical protein